MGFRMAYGYDIRMAILPLHSPDLYHWKLCNLEKLKTMITFIIVFSALFAMGFLANKIKGL